MWLRVITIARIFGKPRVSHPGSFFFFFFKCSVVELKVLPTLWYQTYLSTQSLKVRSLQFVSLGSDEGIGRARLPPEAPEKDPLPTSSSSDGV